jgi:hypothetical protein
MEKTPKKIRVEFEISIDKVKEILEAGTKGPKEITRKELEELSRVGVIRAADYLDEVQTQEAAAAIGKFVGKVTNKATTKLTNKETQKTVIAVVSTEVTNKVVDIMAMDESLDQEDKPKE